MEAAGEMVGGGGWITVLSCELDKLTEHLRKAPNANIILRLYNGGSIFKQSDAPAFVNMLGKLDTGGRVIYVIPWNEPNYYSVECEGKSDCYSYVLQWTNALGSQLRAAGLRGTKVKLLSPALNQVGEKPGVLQSYQDFISNMPANYWQGFDGIALNVYSNGDPNSRDVSEIVGAMNAGGKEIFVVETGKMRPEGGIYYDNSTVADYLRKAYQAWPNVRAITPFSYDPDGGPHNFYLLASGCQDACQAIKSHISPTGYDPADTSAYKIPFETWQGSNCPEGSCQVSSQYCAGMVRSCTTPKTQNLDQCCPENLTTPSQSGSIVEWAKNAAEWLIGEIKSNWITEVTATINFSNIESPGKDLSNLIGGNPNTQTEVAEGAKAIECSGGEGIAWCNGIANLFSLPGKLEESIEAWKTPVKSSFLTKVDSDTGTPGERHDGERLAEKTIDETNFDMFDNLPIKTGLDSMAFLKYPESAKSETASVNIDRSVKYADASIPQGGSVLSTEATQPVETHSICQEPDTNDQIQNTCQETLAVGVTQPPGSGISLWRAFDYILHGVELKSSLAVANGEAFEWNFWRSVSEGENTPEKIKEASQYVGLTNIFQIPTEEESKALPAEGKAKANVNIQLVAPAFITDVLGQKYKYIPLLQKQVDVKLKFRGMGVMGDMQTIAQKMEIPSESGSSSEVPTAGGGPRVAGVSTVAHELSLSEKIGSGIGNFLSGIFSL